GALLFIPAANTRIYLYFLFALGLLSTGITLLQVAANPYVSILGPAHKASSRLSLVGTFNSFGASLGPFIGGLFILTNLDYSQFQIESMEISERIHYLNNEAASVKIPYLILAGCLFALALIIYFSRLPEIQIESENKNNIDSTS